MLTQLPNINIVGSGPCFPTQFTLETINMLNQCDRIFTIINECDCDAYRNLVSKPTENLRNLFLDNQPRYKNYDQVVKYIIGSCEKNISIAYLTYGNPVFYDSITQKLILEAERNNLTCYLAPAVSFLDTMMAALQKDPSPGLQMYEASVFVGAEIKPRVDVPLILVQVGVFASMYPDFEFKEEKRHSLIPLRDYLLNFYPPETQVTFVRTAPTYNHHDYLKPYPLDKIGEVDKNDLANTTLFIPELEKLQMKYNIYDKNKQFHSTQASSTINIE